MTVQEMRDILNQFPGDLKITYICHSEYNGFTGAWDIDDDEVQLLYRSSDCQLDDDKGNPLTQGEQVVAIG